MKISCQCGNKYFHTTVPGSLYITVDEVGNYIQRDGILSIERAEAINTFECTSCGREAFVDAPRPKLGRIPAATGVAEAIMDLIMSGPTPRVKTPREIFEEVPDHIKKEMFPSEAEYLQAVKEYNDMLNGWDDHSGKGGHGDS